MKNHGNEDLFTDIWEDPARFRAFIRGVIVIAAQLVAVGTIDLTWLGLPPAAVGILAAMATGGAIMIPARDTHPSKVEEKEKIPPTVA